jgi:hypothetical protein
MSGFRQSRGSRALDKQSLSFDSKPYRFGEPNRLVERWMVIAKQNLAYSFPEYKNSHEGGIFCAVKIVKASFASFFGFVFCRLLDYYL